VCVWFVVVVVWVSFWWDGDGGVAGVFSECVMVLCLEVVSFGFFGGYWACFCLLFFELYVLWGLIVRCVCVFVESVFCFE